MAEYSPTNQLIPNQDVCLIDDRGIPDDPSLAESESDTCEVDSSVSPDSYAAAGKSVPAVTQPETSFIDGIRKKFSDNVASAYSVYNDAAKYFAKTPVEKIVVDAGEMAVVAGKTIIKSVVEAHPEEVATLQKTVDYVVDTPVQKMADDAIQTVKVQAKQMVADAVEYVAENHPEEVAAVQSLVASAESYVAPFYERFKSILPEPARAVVEVLEGEAVKLYAKNREVLAPVLALIGGSSMVASMDQQAGIESIEFTKPVIQQVAAIEKTVDTPPAPKSTATPLSAPVVEETAANSWSPDYDYSVAEAEGEIDEADGIAEEDVASSVLTVPAEETVVVAQTQAAPAEVKKEEVVAEKAAAESKPVTVAQTTTTQTNVTPVSENEGFASNVEYYAAEVSPSLSGVAVAAGQARSTSASASAAEATTEPRQKLNLPGSTRETVAVADGSEESKQNGVAEKVSVDGIAVEERLNNAEVAVQIARRKQPVAGDLPASAVALVGLTDAERAAEFSARDGIADARFVPVPSAAAATVSRKDSAATDGELGAVAANLDAPLNNVSAGGDKGFGSDDQGRDRSTENIHFYSDAADAIVDNDDPFNTGAVIRSTIGSSSDVVI